jgi:ABC-type oligopeptide transport system ATPase subunit
MAIVSLHNVEKTYPLGKTEVHAVKGVSFDIERGRLHLHRRSIRIRKIHHP